MLVVANLLPVYGVLALDWPVFQLFALYWMEVIVVGIVAVLSMLYVPVPGVVARAGKLVTLLFFCIGYGILSLVYALFLAVIFKNDAFLRLFHGLLGVSSVAIVSTPDFASIVVYAFLGAGLLLLKEVGKGWFAVVTIGGIAASHLLAFFRHYVGRGDIRKANLPNLGFEPFSYLALMHVVVIAAGSAALSGASYAWVPLLVIAVKTAVDLLAHLREWSRLHQRR